MFNGSVFKQSKASSFLYQMNSPKLASRSVSPRSPCSLSNQTPITLGKHKASIKKPKKVVNPVDAAMHKYIDSIW